MKRVVAMVLVIACANAQSQEAQSPTAQSAACTALDAEYRISLPKLDRAVEDAVGIAKHDSTRSHWATAQESAADLAAAEADYASLHKDKGCSSELFTLPNASERELDIDPNAKPFLLQFTHGVAQAAGIGLLKDLSVPEGETELRIWTGFGIDAPDDMLRFRIDAKGHVTGDVLVHFRHDIARPGGSGRAEDAMAYWAHLVGGCGALREGTIHDTCFANPARPPNWRAVHKKLVHLGIETLPDQDALPDDGIISMDGVSMVVELRKGAQYRAYAYTNPDVHDQPEAWVANTMLDLVFDTVDKATGQDK